MDGRLDALERGMASLNAAIEKIGLAIQKTQETLQIDIANLGEENNKRADEIRILASKIGQLATDDESIGINHTAVEHLEPEDEEEEIPKQRIPLRRAVTELPGTFKESAVQAKHVPAKDIVRTIRALNGKDDIGVEDFIKAVKRARAQCNEEDLLLGLIIAEKIADQAERSIRHLAINSYEELYENLRLHVSPPVTISNARSKLHNIKQGFTETVQSFNLRYRQQLNELRYAIQNKYPRPMARRIALEEEEETATAQYILNLRQDIGKLVIARDPQTLATAQQIALEMEIWTREAQNRTSSRQASQTLSRPRPTQMIRRPYQPAPSRQEEKTPTGNHHIPNHALPLQQRLQLKCTICGKIGHERDQCFKRNFQLPQTGKLPPRINHLQEEITKNEEESQEFPVQADDYDTSPPGLEECADLDDSYWTQEQA